jgi:hypothetical protein
MTAKVAPIFVTVQEAAAILGGDTSPWTVNNLCRLGAIESKWSGEGKRRRRLVRLASVHAYADSLPDGIEKRDAS